MFRKLLFSSAIIASTQAIAAVPAAQFLRSAIQGDNSEARLGRLIARLGASLQVRQFGAALTRDHMQARAQAWAVARQIGVRPPTQMMPQARIEYAKLSHMRGRAFDLEVRRYTISDHRNDISDFSSQARGGDRRTATLARAQLPTLHKHLRLAESIRG